MLAAPALQEWTKKVSSNFDWRTDDDRYWEDGQTAGRRGGRRRRWVLPVVIVLLAIVAVAAVYWQVQERFSAAEAALGDDIRSSFQLIRQAQEEGDIELFRNLLSGSNLGWASAQQELFAQGWLFDLGSFGLAYEPQSVTEIQVTLSPELNSAEVTALATYQVAGGDAAGGIQLRQTSVFRRGERWVWSPPRADFWMGEARTGERYLSVTYPVRDEALALRLARDLNRLIETLCNDVFGQACPESFSIALILSKEPAALVDLNEQHANRGSSGRQARANSHSTGLQLTLPTPSLIGEPLDEASYQVLYKGYGTHLARAVIERIADSDCCGSMARFRAAERNALGSLGLDPWFGVEIEASAAAERLPGEDRVALLCSDGFERRQRLFLLNLADMTWQERTLPAELLAVKAMPDGDGVLLLSQTAEGQDRRSQIWHLSPEGSFMLFDRPVSAAQAEQMNWELLEHEGLLVIEVPELRGGYSRYFTIDLRQCESGDCPVSPQSTVSRPVWSPDGSQLLVHAYGLLWWRVGDTLVPIGDGSAPFWIDEANYGYVRSFGQEQAVVIVQPGEDPLEQVMLTTTDLRSALDPDHRIGRLLIGRVMVNLPTDNLATGGEWLVLAFEMGRDGAVNQAYFFTYDPGSGKARVIPHSGQLMSFNLSPSREKLALGGFVEETGQWEITVVGHEMIGAARVQLESGGLDAAAPSYSWSPDESWLLLLDQGLLTLFEPASGLVHKVRPPEASCVQAAWYGESSGR